MMSFKSLSVVVSAVLAAASLRGNSVVDAWTSAPMGIAVTRCEYSTRGVFVQFETDLEPPYFVGVYRMNEVGLARRFPIREVRVETTSAFIPIDIVMMPAVFVQVMTPGAAYRGSTNETYRRELTPSEVKAWRTAIERSKTWRNDDPGTTYELRDDGVMDLVDDFMWAGFIKTAETNLSFTLSGRKMEPDVESLATNIVQDVAYTNIRTRVLGSGEVEYVKTNSGSYATTVLGGGPTVTTTTNFYASGGYYFDRMFRHPQHNDHENVVTNYSRWNKHPVPHEYSFRIGDGRSDVGTGYRILMFEDLGICQAQRAYSAKTNMSDVVVIPCSFRALASHDGYIYTSDWEGRRYFQRVTNRVDHVIY